MSIAGGVDASLLRGRSVGCKAIQIFTKSSNQWRAKRLGEEEIGRFKDNRKKTGISEVIAHDSYLINLASPKEELRKRSFNAFYEEMDRCRLLGINHLVMHPGSHTGAGEEEGLKTISCELEELLARTDGWDVNIVLETTAGQGTNLGYRFEHLAAIIDGVSRPERLKVCFDTCHVFAAGYDISTASGFQDVLTRLDKVVGLDRLIAFHLNDSKKGLSSRIDRHEHLGKGAIGPEAFRFLMNDGRFANTPKILETPKGKEMEEDLENLAFLRGLVDEN